MMMNRLQTCKLDTKLSSLLPARVKCGQEVVISQTRLVNTPQSKLQSNSLKIGSRAEYGMSRQKKTKCALSYQKTKMIQTKELSILLDTVTMALLDRVKRGAKDPMSGIQSFGNMRISISSNCIFGRRTSLLQTTEARYGPGAITMSGLWDSIKSPIVNPLK